MSDAAQLVLLDVDGTLVDTNQLHVIAWQRAFRGIGFEIPAWEIHRQVGKGGDKLVAAVAGEAAEREHGDDVRSLHGDEFGALIDEARPLPGARELLLALRARGVTTVLASSGRAEEVDRYIDLLAARELLDGVTTSADVDASKPAPDLVEAALERGGGGRPALLVGDTVWDGEAAARAGIGFVGLRSGGIGAAELRAAGATFVYDDAAELADRLEEVLFSDPSTKPHHS
ncbi:HAD family hydrolase [Conexibacter sp. JD483]|uniref:HAD family hydrolase n=1 Tax=unclassified Conexibacter TaxID=2627773 RepID=UPI002726B702|nr:MULTISPECIES: HAD family hydrolase [unclassified Conexibacter]MDO8185437.1 HAD family hydrolase [Conexibacter sp. CPCC 205706]MDO8198387.1 HAD family hydrolase [Conexibacter sp. CPCC 205762]MDR9369349.1 HAD family hydrolase [Conexibacter sp. JD483]